jgi:hypothetical protein
MIATAEARAKRAIGIMVLDTDVKCQFCPRVFVDATASLEHLKARHAESFRVGCHGKTRYPDEVSANFAISGLLTARGKKISVKYPNRAYKCVVGDCNGWHLTSQKFRPKPKP